MTADRSFRTTTPFILPGRVLLKHAEQVAATQDHTTIGIFTSGARQRPQQLEAWQRQSWAACPFHLLPPPHHHEGRPARPPTAHRLPQEQPGWINRRDNQRQALLVLPELICSPPSLIR
jgi:hypothetical protein